MTLEQACEVLNREGHLASQRGKAEWYVQRWRPAAPMVGTGLGHLLDEFTAIAIAREYERLARDRPDPVLHRPLD